MTCTLQPTALVLAYYYPPDNTSGVFRTLYFFNHIARRDRWRINILTADPEYRAEPNLDKQLNQQIDQRIQVFRTRTINPRHTLIQCRNKLQKHTSGSSGTDNRVWVNNNTDFDSNTLWSRWKDFITEDILSFPDDKIGWLPFALRKADRVIKNNKIDLIYSTGSPWTSHLLAYLLNLRTGLPLVLDYRDPWFGNPYEARHSSLYHRASLALEKKIIKKADRVICNTGRLRALYAETFGTAGKFMVIPNGFEPEEVSPPTCPRGDVFRIVHAGALYGGRNPHRFFEAVLHVVRKNPCHTIKVYLIGAGEAVQQDIRDRFGAEWLERVFVITPRLPHSACMEYLQKADLLLLFQQGTTLQVPRKLYEYIGLKKTILGICNQGETADLIQNNRLGAVVPDDTLAIEDTLTTIINTPARFKCDNGLEQFSNKKLARKLEAVFDDITEKYRS